MSDLLGFFDRVVLLNLDRRRDRLQATYAELNRVGWPFKWPERFSAVDSRAVSPPEGWTIASGGWGCLQSHRQVLERAIMDHTDRLLIIEDDICLRDDFRIRVSEFLATVPPKWDAIMLGGEHMEPPDKQSVPARCTNTQRTHCYALSAKFMQVVYKAWSDPRNFNQHCDWIMAPMLRHVNAYCPRPTFLAGQSGKWSDIVTVGDKAPCFYEGL